VSWRAMAAPRKASGPLVANRSSYRLRTAAAFYIAWKAIVGCLAG